jgi:hypothetical protein
VDFVVYLATPGAANCLEHAEQGLDAVAEYATYYELELREATDIVDTALEENIYLKRYFGSEAAALLAAT